MIRASYHFPPGFLWGAATSSHQVEGDNRNNDWWAWEQNRSRFLESERSGTACEWWRGRWKQDMALAEQAGLNSIRFSLEWSRIEPSPALWDLDALDRYREIAGAARELGLEPVVTLNHFTLPKWIAARGGWLHEDIVRIFERYVAYAVNPLKDLVSIWVTLNAPLRQALQAHFHGRWPPGSRSFRSALLAIRHQALAHARAYHTIHALDPEARVGVGHFFQEVGAHQAGHPLHRRAAARAHALHNLSFPSLMANGQASFPGWNAELPQVAATQDFFGMAYYDAERSDPRAELESARSEEEQSAGAHGNHPEGLWRALRWVRRFDLPIMVLENRSADAQGVSRPGYMARHIHTLWRAVNFNWPVRGYYHWTLVDCFEWDAGWSKPYGLWALDRSTQARKKRPSAAFYADIARHNAVRSESVAEYAPEAFDALYPPRGAAELITEQR